MAYRYTWDGKGAVNTMNWGSVRGLEGRVWCPVSIFSISSLSGVYCSSSLDLTFQTVYFANHLDLSLCDFSFSCYWNLDIQAGVRHLKREKKPNNTCGQCCRSPFPSQPLVVYPLACSWGWVGMLLGVGRMLEEGISEVWMVRQYRVLGTADHFHHP